MALCIITIDSLLFMCQVCDERGGSLECNAVLTQHSHRRSTRSSEG
jgi:hypothetical protein